MTRANWLLMALLTGLAGCDRVAPYKAVYAEQIKTMQDELTVLKQVTDPASMERVRPELRKINWRIQSTSKKFKALPELGHEAKTQIEREFQGSLQDLAVQLQHEAQRISELPGGKEFLNTLKHL